MCITNYYIFKVFYVHFYFIFSRFEFNIIINNYIIIFYNNNFKKYSIFSWYFNIFNYVFPSIVFSKLIFMQKLTKSYKQLNFATIITSFLFSKTQKCIFYMAIFLTELVCGCAYTALQLNDRCGSNSYKVINAFRETYQLGNNKAIYCVRCTRQTRHRKRTIKITYDLKIIKILKIGIVSIIPISSVTISYFTHLYNWYLIL